MLSEPIVYIATNTHARKETSVVIKFIVYDL